MNKAVGTNLLVVRFSSLGDVAMSVPVVKQLLSKFPNTKIDFVSNTNFKALFNGIENLHYIGFDKKKKNKGFLGLIRFFSLLKSNKYDMVIDLHDSLRAKIITFLFRLSGVSTYTINKGREEKKRLTRERQKEFKQLKTTHQRYTDVFIKGGFQFHLNTAHEEQKRKMGEQVRSFTGVKKEKWIGLSPFAAYKSKTYGIDNCLELVTLLKETDFKLFVFGGAADKSSAKLLEEQSESVFSVIGNLSMEEELELIANLDLMICVDSANMHLASMEKTRCLSIWGVTHPFAGFNGFGQSDEDCITVDRKQFPLVPTSIYGNKQVTGYDDCINTIKPKEIIKKTLEILSKKD